MSVQNQKKLNKKLVTLMSVASTSIFFGFPALALNNSNSSNIDGSLNNRSSRTESTHSSRQLLAQGTSGTVQPGTVQPGTAQPGTVQPGTVQPGTVQPGTVQPGTVQPGTVQPGTVQPGTGTGTALPDTGGTTTGTGQVNVQQGSFEQVMRAGYAATQQRDYSTALAYFQRALQLRPNNPYARQAVSNVQGYIQRTTQTGTTSRPNNQGNR
jgi:hypothetical protein